MNARHIFFTTALLLISAGVLSQSISVASFRVLPNDQTARVTYPVTDQNGEKCALLKVVTGQQGFAWEAGTLGITKVEKKTGEYWIYIPHGSKKITIKHDRLGVLRDYIYPEAIKAATVYEMILTTGTVKTIIEQSAPPSQWLIIKTEPAGASVFINDKLAGQTPFQRKYKEGEYTYRIEKPMYHNTAGKILLKGEKESLELTLKPQFGSIKVNSVPEEGMFIYLDGNNTNKKTPATLEEVMSGEHTLQLRSPWYQPVTKKVNVEDEQTTVVSINLAPAFANIKITTTPAAKIIIDGQEKGLGEWSGRLMEGVYTVRAEKEKYYDREQQLEVVSGQDKTLHFALKGKTGNADIVTTPMEADVYLDGERKGTSPLTLNNLLIGEHKLRLEKEGYAHISKTILIEENATVTVNEKLPDVSQVN
ncbi:MAG TPA: PEGA domain-containing protein, partial [Bacteroidetes bacterium]|nr:PEGA domain-containing protein [Bacteroidota bacterium]